MKLPTPPQIAHAPELAALAAADHALELMWRSLVAAHPELVDQEASPLASRTPVLHLASELVHRAASLQGLLRRYARSLDRELLNDIDDVTF